MSLQKSKILPALICIACATIFAAAAQVGFDKITDSRNVLQLKSLTQQAIRRAELAVDFAFISLGTIIEKSNVDCTARSLTAFRKQVFQRATIKDIMLLNKDGKVLCAAFPEASASVNTKFDLQNARQSSNSKIRLMRVVNSSVLSLAVIWDLDGQGSIVALVNTSAMLFDILPGDIRDYGEALVQLMPGGGHVAHYSSTIANSETYYRVFANSGRYPLRAEIGISRARLMNWNHELYTVWLLLAGFAGFAFGYLVVKLIFREPDPIVQIDRAIRAGEFIPFFQPIFSLKTGAITGCEVLARWVKPDGTVVAPYYFIPLAESSGRITALTWSLLDQSLQQLRPVLLADRNFSLGFNVTATQMMEADFGRQLRHMLASKGINAGQIVVELTEREQLQDLQKAAKVVAALQQTGCTVAVDDAGTGSSGLSYIQKLGVDIIKIDKLFVDSLLKERSAKILIELLVGLAKELDMITVAEGIESQDQAKTLAELGVDKGQGYLVARPLTGIAFLALLESRRTRDTNSGSAQRAA